MGKLISPLSGIGRTRTLLTATAASRTAAAAGPGTVELAEITDQLLEKRQLPAGCRGRPGDRRDFFAIFQDPMVDGSDDPLVVKVDDVNLLVEHIGFEKSSLSGAAAYVIPGFVVIEDADAGRRSQYFGDLVFCRAARVNFSNLVHRGQITALLDSWGAARHCCGPGDEA